MSSKLRLVVIAALAAAAAAFLKRPVKPPASEGTWHPTESTPTRH